MPDPLSRRRRAIRFLPSLVATGFIALIIGAAAVVWLQVESQRYSSMVEHTLDVESRIARMTASVERLETVRRGFLLTGRDTFVRRAEGIAAELPNQLDGLRSATADNPAQQQRADVLIRLAAQQRERLNWAWRLDAAERARLAGMLEEDPGVLILQRIRATGEEMQADEQALLTQRSAAQGALVQAFYAVFAAVGLLLVAVGVLTFVVLRRYTGEINTTADALQRLNEGLESMVDERTRDLRRANDEIQRFAYIVSHDLRSPLVNVMGFTAELEAAGRAAEKLIARVEEQAPDLMDREAAVAVREDLPEAVGFIRTSTQKMDRLINAILKLSREGRRNLAVEPLDMDAMVGGIIDSLHQRAHDAGAELKASPLPAIVSDRVAIEQILSNLVENAIKYLQPGRPGLIEVRGTRIGDRVTYEVEDNGRGIDPRDHERIFDLFRRSGVQDRPGEGIGLAHVRALAYRLGGVIDVRSQLGSGATFRLSLPARLVLGEGES